MSHRFGPEDLLACYGRGVFPMADSADDPNIFLVDPDLRGILPLENFHVPRRLMRTVRQNKYKVTINTAFTRVIEACAEATDNRENTWINSPIVNLYCALHRMGHAQSVEVWNTQDKLVGGLYGVSLGGAFFGESMFSRETDASKVALVHLVARLQEGGFKLLDAQFHNTHLEQFGLIELTRKDFKRLLAKALECDADFYCSGSASFALSSLSSGSTIADGSGISQRITQTS